MEIDSLTVNCRSSTRTLPGIMNAVCKCGPADKVPLFGQKLICYKCQWGKTKTNNKKHEHIFFNAMGSQHQYLEGILVVGKLNQAQALVSRSSIWTIFPVCVYCCRVEAVHSLPYYPPHLAEGLAQNKRSINVCGMKEFCKYSLYSVFPPFKNVIYG